jgi:hypothetical protein
VSLSPPLGCRAYNPLSCTGRLQVHTGDISVLTRYYGVDEKDHGETFHVRRYIRGSGIQPRCESGNT